MTISRNPTLSALLGLSLAIPLFVANAIVGNRIEPFFSLIRPGFHTSAREYLLLAVVLLCLPAGAFIAVRPTLLLPQERRRAIHFFNGILAVVMLGLFIALSIGLGADIYRCDVLQIPNCD